MIELLSQRNYSNDLICFNIRTTSISCSTSILVALLFWFVLLCNNKNGQKKKKKNVGVLEEEKLTGVVYERWMEVFS